MTRLNICGLSRNASRIKSMSRNISFPAIAKTMDPNSLGLVNLPVGFYQPMQVNSMIRPIASTPLSATYRVKPSPNPFGKPIMGCSWPFLRIPSMIKRVGSVTNQYGGLLTHRPNCRTTLNNRLQHLLGAIEKLLPQSISPIIAQIFPFVP